MSCSEHLRKSFEFSLEDKSPWPVRKPGRASEPNRNRKPLLESEGETPPSRLFDVMMFLKIGRASCRERV